MRFLSDEKTKSLYFLCVNVSPRTHQASLFSILGKEAADFYEQVPIIIRELIYRLNDDDATVLKAAHKAFSALSKSVPAEDLVSHVEFMRNLINSMVSDARRRKGGVGDGEFLLPGFNIPKGEYMPWLRVRKRTTAR